MTLTAVSATALHISQATNATPGSVLLNRFARAIGRAQKGLLSFTLSLSIHPSLSDGAAKFPSEQLRSSGNIHIRVPGQIRNALFHLSGPSTFLMARER